MYSSPVGAVATGHLPLSEAVDVPHEAAINDVLYEKQSVARTQNAVPMYEPTYNAAPPRRLSHSELVGKIIV